MNLVEVFIKFLALSLSSFAKEGDIDPSFSKEVQEEFEKLVYIQDVKDSMEEISESDSLISKVANQVMDELDDPDGIITNEYSYPARILVLLHLLSKIKNKKVSLPEDPWISFYLGAIFAISLEPGTKVIKRGGPESPEQLKQHIIRILELVAPYFPSEDIPPELKEYLSSIGISVVKRRFEPEDLVNITDEEIEEIINSMETEDGSKESIPEEMKENMRKTIREARQAILADKLKDRDSLDLSN